MDFNCFSKIDGCSLRKIGELPFSVSENIKCIGIPGSVESSDEILLVDKTIQEGNQYAVMYV